MYTKKENNRTFNKWFQENKSMLQGSIFPYFISENKNTPEIKEIKNAMKKMWDDARREAYSEICNDVLLKISKKFI